MATTAAMNLNSDLMTGSLSASANSTLMKARTTADGLDQMRMGYNKIPTGTSFNLLDATTAGIDKAAKVYICNESEDETEYAIVKVSGNVIGKLYAGDFLWMPWSMAEDADSDNKHADIQLTPSVATGMWFSWCMVNEGTEYPTSV